MYVLILRYNISISVRNIYTIGSQRISSSGRHSAIHRDPTIAIMAVEAFQTFLTKFKVGTGVTIH